MNLNCCGANLFSREGTPFHHVGGEGSQIMKLGGLTRSSCSGMSPEQCMSSITKYCYFSALQMELCSPAGFEVGNWSSQTNLTFYLRGVTCWYVDISSAPVVANQEVM